jgi:hypothetical protein
MQVYLEDQTAVLVQTIQSLVAAVRNDSGLTAITTELGTISSTISSILSSTSQTMSSSPSLHQQSSAIVDKLSSCKQRVDLAGSRGREIAEREDDAADLEWKQWCQGLPPLAFEVARETKELVRVVDEVETEGGEGTGEDYS